MLESCRGFTIIEVLFVLTVIGIMIAISVPFFGGYVEQVSSAVCMANRNQFQRMYEAHLMAENTRHSIVEFGAFLDAYEKDICPRNGVITLLEQRLLCSVHQDSGKDDDGDPVPFL